MDILYTAKKYVHIMTPYLILDHDMIRALTYAAKRGVEVIIIMPHIPDKWYAFVLAKTYYQELMEAGVQIYEFTPGFVHAKVFTSDDRKAVVGSIYLDYRSLYLHFECAVYLYKNKEISAVEEDFQKTLAQCQKMGPEAFRQQPLINRIAGKVLRLVAPLM
jgi:cardiolipin synthase